MNDNHEFRCALTESRFAVALLAMVLAVAVFILAGHLSSTNQRVDVLETQVSDFDRVVAEITQTATAEWGRCIQYQAAP